jgi:FixJ family two-component response regulator
MAEPGVVYVVDDDPSMRDLMDATLRAAGLLVKTFASAEELLADGALVRHFPGIDAQPDNCLLGQPPGGGERGGGGRCLLLDLEMPGASGLDLLEKLKREHEQAGADGVPCPVIVITGRASVGGAVRSMKLGAVDLFEKPFRTEDLVKRVLETLESHKHQQQRAAERIAIRERIAILSPRERELLDAIVQGRSTKMIADSLGISARTVDHHRANLMQKMRADNVADLVRMSVQSDYHSVG